MGLEARGVWDPQEGKGSFLAPCCLSPGLGSPLPLQRPMGVACLAESSVHMGSWVVERGYTEHVEDTAKYLNMNCALDKQVNFPGCDDSCGHEENVLAGRRQRLKCLEVKHLDVCNLQMVEREKHKRSKFSNW